MHSPKVLVGSLVAWTFIAFTTGAVADNDSKYLRIATNIVTGIIKTAGQLSATKVCELALPNIVCQLVVNPITRALYAEAPHLRPKIGDTRAILAHKGDALARHFEKSTKFQALVSERLAHSKKRLDAVNFDIKKLGSTQNEITHALSRIANHQLLLEKRVDEHAASIKKLQEERRAERENSNEGVNSKRRIIEMTEEELKIFDEEFGLERCPFPCQ